MKSKSCFTAKMVFIHWFIISSLFFFSEIENLEFQINRIFSSANFDTASAKAINNNGHVVGNIGTFPTQSSYPFIYVNNFVIDLAAEVGINSTLVDINDSDEIIGVTRSESKENGFSYSKNIGFKNLTYSNEGSVSAINSLGQIIGTQVINSVSHPTIFFNNAALTLEVNAEFFDINNELGERGVGTLTGACKSGDSHFPCYMIDGQIQDLEICLPGVAVAVNNKNVIIGNCGNSSAFIYHTSFYNYFYDTQFIAINDDGWVLSQIESSPYLITLTNTTASNYISYDLMELLPSNSGITTLYPVALNNNGQIVANSNLGPVILNPVNTANHSSKRKMTKKKDRLNNNHNSKK